MLLSSRRGAGGSQGAHRPPTAWPYLALALPVGLVAVWVEAFADSTVAGATHGVPPPAFGARKVDPVGKIRWQMEAVHLSFFGTRGRLEAWALTGLGLGTALPLSGLPSTGLSISSPAPRPQGPHLQGLYYSTVIKGICLLTFFFHTEDTDEGPTLGTRLPRDTVSARSLCPAPPHHDPGSWGCGGWGA